MKTFKLENVKSFVNSGEIEIKPISIFVGRNSSGKSSLIRFPVMLSQTYTEDIFTPFLFFGNQIDYGNFDDVIHNHNGEEIKFTLGFDKKQILRQPVYTYRSRFYKDSFRGILNNHDDYSISVTINKFNKKIVVKEFVFHFGESKLFTILRNSKNKYNLYFNKLISDTQLVDCDDNFKININLRFNKFMPQLEIIHTNILIVQLIQLIDTEGIFDTSNNNILEAIKDQEYDQATKILDNLSEEHQEILNKVQLYVSNIYMIESLLKSLNRHFISFANTLSYIGPFRKDPERIYRESESSYMDVGKNGENASMILRQSHQEKDKLLQKVSNWFLDSMGYKINIEEIDNSNLFKLMVSSPDGKISHNIMDVGYGVAQVLPIVTQIYYENTVDDEIRSMSRYGRKKTFVIEQPELHLHPAAQASLANLFVQKVIDSSEVNFLIETHSEHFIRKLQVLVADPDVKITNNDIGIYYIDKMEGYSEVKIIHLNENGQFIEQWPPGFFDKSFELSRELVRVSSKEKKNEN